MPGRFKDIAAFATPRHRIARGMRGLATLAMALVGAAMFCTTTWAADGANAEQSAAAPGTAFDIIVHAPADVRELIENHAELQRYRSADDLDDGDMERLLAPTESNVRSLLGTLGYFDPVVRVARTAAANGQRPSIVIDIEPGAATVAGAVTIDFSGDIATSTDADAIAQREQIRREWRLASGRRFTQDAWDEAKTAALRQLVARRYPAGRLAASSAEIDPAQHLATLALTFDSGPHYRLGPLEIKGVKRYDPVLAPRLAQLHEGDSYDQQKLLDAQQRLMSSGYFDSAYLLLDPAGDPLAAPVQAQLREAKLQKLVLGIGATTDSGPRLSAEHTIHRIPGIDWSAVTKLQIDRNTPFAQTEWMSIPDEQHWRWDTLLRAERLDDNQLITQSRQWRVGRVQSGDPIDRNIYVQYDRTNVYGNGLNGTTAAEAGDGSALTANYMWTGRYFDSLPFANSGYGIGVELGAGSTLGDKRDPFARVVGRWMGIQRLPIGRLALRAEAGAVLAQDAAPIPATQLFRTGGDNTVRGYGYRDIGIKLSNGTIGPGRYMAVGSVEWQRPILRDGLPSDWENTFFIDAGSVADKPKDMDFSVGIGTGLRWKSPIGPVQLAVAYGMKTGSVRLHMSVGFTF